VWPSVREYGRNYLATTEPLKTHYNSQYQLNILITQNGLLRCVFYGLTSGHAKEIIWFMCWCATLSVDIFIWLCFQINAIKVIDRMLKGHIYIFYFIITHMIYLVFLLSHGNVTLTCAMSPWDVVCVRTNDRTSTLSLEDK